RLAAREPHATLLVGEVVLKLAAGVELHRRAVAQHHRALLAALRRDRGFAAGEEHGGADGDRGTTSGESCGKRATPLCALRAVDFLRETRAKLAEKLGLRLETLRPRGDAIAACIRLAIRGIGREPILERNPFLWRDVVGAKPRSPLRGIRGSRRKSRDD